MSNTCEICKKAFSTAYNLNKHCRIKHNLKRKAYRYAGDTFNFQCLECDCSFRKGADLVEHLEGEHSQKIEEETFEFENIEDFNFWKDDIEHREKCNYIVSAGKKELSSGDVMQYFYCNRSGSKRTRLQNAKDVIDRKRKLKKQGSSKLNYSCISKITLRTTKDRLYVTRIITHYGHSNDVWHLRISQFDKEELASKLVDGVSQKKILEDIRSNVDAYLKRADLITRQDLVNIKRSYNIEQHNEKKHKNASASASLLTQFGNNIIAIDSTHGLDNYDFEMATIMVVDEFNEGFPVAVMFSNRIDPHFSCMFFNAIKKTVGVLNCNIFMSDNTETFYDAWVQVMGAPVHHLYCSWHIDRAWRTGLDKIIHKSKKGRIYKSLKYLQKNMDITETFFDELNLAVDKMLNDPDTTTFGKYFSQYYSNNYVKWAYCFHKSCGVNHNLKLESMHKVIRYFSINPKAKKKLDEALHATIKYIKEKIVDRYLNHPDGIHSYNEGNLKTHKLALLSSFLITEIGTEKWNVTLNDNEYIVEKTSVLEKCCLLHCQFCEICVHQYSCSCPNYFTSSLICKHIHYVAFKNDRNSASQKLKHENSNGSECSDFYSHSSTENVNCDKKELILKELSDLQLLVRSQDVNQLSQSNFHYIISTLRSTRNLFELAASQIEILDATESVKNEADNKEAVPRLITVKKQSIVTNIENPAINGNTNVTNQEYAFSIAEHINSDHAYL